MNLSVNFLLADKVGLLLLFPIDFKLWIYKENGHYIYFVSQECTEILARQQNVSSVLYPNVKARKISAKFADPDVCFWKKFCRDNRVFP